MLKVLQHLDEVYKEEGIEAAVLEAVRVYELTPTATRKEPLQAMDNAYEVYLKQTRNALNYQVSDNQWNAIFADICGIQSFACDVTYNDATIENMCSLIKEAIPGCYLTMSRSQLVEKAISTYHSISMLAMGQYLCGLLLKYKDYADKDKLYKCFIVIRYFLLLRGYKLKLPDNYQVTECLSDFSRIVEVIDLVVSGSIIFNINLVDCGWCGIIAEACEYPTLIEVDRTPSQLSTLSKVVYKMVSESTVGVCPAATWFVNIVKEYNTDLRPLDACSFMAGFVAHYCYKDKYAAAFTLTNIYKFIEEYLQVDLATPTPSDMSAFIAYLNSRQEGRVDEKNILSAGRLLFKAKQ